MSSYQQLDVAKLLRPQQLLLRSEQTTPALAGVSLQATHGTGAKHSLQHNDYGILYPWGQDGRSMNHIKVTPSTNVWRTWNFNSLMAPYYSLNIHII